MVFQGSSRSKVGWSAKYCAGNNSLNERRSHWLRRRNKTSGKSEGSPWVLSIFLFPTKNGAHMGSYSSEITRGDFSRNFWIGQPLVSESELGFFNQIPAFWSFASKMMSILFPPEHPGGRGIRPHSLKVTTIAVLMGGNCQGKGKPVSTNIPRKLKGGHGPRHGVSLFAKLGASANFRLEVCSKNSKGR